MRSTSFLKLSLTALCLVISCGLGHAQTTSFTYQGKLTDGGAPANVPYDLQFKLFDALSGGSLQGSPNTITKTGVQVTSGIFTVQLDFGAGAFPGAARFLEIAVKRSTDDSYTTLSPRQQVTSTPYALRSLTAETLFIGGNRAFAITGGLAGGPNFLSNTFVGVDVGASNLPSDNTNAGNANSFFGRSAGRSNTDGSSNSFFGFRAGYNNQSGFHNSFFGSHAGLSNTNETYNTFLGNQTDGASGVNSATAIGAFAKVTRSNSIVLGGIAGVNGATSDTNVGIGTTNPTAKLQITDASNTGLRVETLSAGGRVASFGANGEFLVDAPGRPGGRFLIREGGFVGIDTSPEAKLHVHHSTFDAAQPIAILDGSGGTQIPLEFRLGSIKSARIRADNNGNLVLATIGLSSKDIHFRAGDDANTDMIIDSATGNVGIGTTGPAFKLEVIDSSNTGLRVQTNATGGTVASFGGNGIFQVDAPGVPGGRLRILDNGNVGIGTTAPTALLHVTGAQPSGNGANAPEILRIIGGQGGDTTASGGGQGSGGGVYIQGGGTGGASTGGVGGSITLQPGLASNPLRNGAVLLAPADGNVGVGTNAPTGRFHVLGASSFPAIQAIAIIESSGDQIPLNFNIGATQHARIRSDNAGNLVLATLNGGAKDIYFRAGDDSGTDMFIRSSDGNVGVGTTTPNDKLEINGVLRVNAVGSAGGIQLCRNLSNQISNCSSSLRYKTNIAPFSSGLSFIKQLRPISFDWRQGGMRDVGFGAEDVARINPLFVSHNDKGEIEGVKYDRLSVAFVNAFREQQSQIENLQKLIESQQQQINALRKLVCATNADAAICKQ